MVEEFERAGFIHDQARMENPAGRKMTSALGKGAAFSAPSNRKRPRRRRISPFMAKQCHQEVSVLAGTRQTTVAPCLEDSYAFFIHLPMARPYGGFMNTTASAQSCPRPSSRTVKCRAHLALAWLEQGSRVNSNSRCSASNSHWGVGQSSRMDMKCTETSVLTETIYEFRLESVSGHPWSRGRVAAGSHPPLPSGLLARAGGDGR